MVDSSETARKVGHALVRQSITISQRVQLSVYLKRVGTG